MKREAAQKMEASDLQRFGHLLEHWDVSKLGNLTEKIGSGKTPRGGAETYVSEGVLLIRSQNVYDSGLRLSEAVFIDESVDEEMSGTRVCPGDVLLNITGASLGRCALVPSDFPRANVNQHVCIIRIRPGRALPAYVKRAISSQAVQSQIFSFESGSSREGLNYDQVRSLRLPLPFVSEQLAITNFLDGKIAQLDALVAKKCALIERLKEKRSALISHTVTCGLPPETARAAGLELNPRMKPSGIEWLGNVPEHWRVVPLKWCAHSSSGDIIGNDDVESEPTDVAHVPVIGGNGVMGFTTKHNIRETVLAVGRVGALCGNVHLVDYPAWITDNALVLKWNRSAFDARFLVALLVNRNLNELAERTAQPLITGSKLRDQRMLCPPLPEQRAIADFLDQETAKIDALLAKVEQAIERLQEYRTALITAAVTGKIDVGQERSGLSGQDGRHGHNGRRASQPRIESAQEGGLK